MTAAVTRGSVLVLIVGMLLSNFALRYVSLATLSRVELPRPIMRWLGYIPVAVMGALLANEILVPAIQSADGRTHSVTAIPLWLNPGIYGMAAAMLSYRLTKSFMGGTVAGIAVFAVLQWLL